MALSGLKFQPDTDYYYRLRAYSGAIWSTNSNVITVRTAGRWEGTWLLSGKDFDAHNGPSLSLEETQDLPVIVHSAGTKGAYRVITDGIDRTFQEGGDVLEWGGYEYDEWDNHVDKAIRIEWITNNLAVLVSSDMRTGAANRADATGGWIGVYWMVRQPTVPVTFPRRSLLKVRPIES